MKPLIVVATAGEAARLHSLTARVVVSGVGPVAAALATASALAKQPAPLVVSTGIAGAFPSSGLQPGDLAVSSLIVQADLGAWEGDQWLPLDRLGLSIHPAVLHHAEFEVWAGAKGIARELGAGFGPALTVSSVTGDHATAARLEARYPGAQTEGMEGAGVAHAALLAGVPVIEVRGISNLVGPRDRRAWKIGPALDAAQTGVAALLQHLN
ncbi:futalosine hydrolase [Deinococcus deserti]|uniref:Futalosine hydrolase n=1 Tax=Deinococcus deserti (strain DSM 17065 / CIP 109153 / LMG 22923 / VCD115) TaxID=546414 RepID=C1D193_DEIDV|nr:futalosine hydrolase [Deinococcus deserti]ACO45617.1 putative adenosylhomocysteine nucleosidase [Deinococcus deserti VCD115]